jgi:dynein heavy chain
MSSFYSSIPSSGNLWNIYLNIESRRLDLWESLVPVFTYNPSTPFFEMTVPTMETIKMGFIMERLLEVNHPVLLTGLTGKTASCSVLTEYY